MAIVTRYVNTAASAGGNGTTNATTSGDNTHAYNSLAAWNAAEATDLVTAGDSHVVICTGGQDTLTGQISFAGWTTGASNTLTIKSNDVRNPANGFADGYRLYISKASGEFHIFYALKDYVTLENIYAEGNSTAGGTVHCASLTGIVYAGLVFDSCWFRVSGSATAGKSCIQSHGSADNSTSIIIKNCILDAGTVSGGVSYGFRGLYASGADVFIYNCTITNHTGAGVTAQGETIVVKNCAVFNNADDFQVLSGTISADYCASDDGDGTNPVDISPGGTESTDWAAAFMDYANGDFRIKDTNSVLYNAGTDLSGSGITDDLIGTARPQASTYDIGAFELIASSAPKGRLLMLGVG